jgi:hypothetical protein
MQNFFEDEDEIDREVDDIISQIKNQSRTINSTQDFQPKEISKEEMEMFIINNAASVVQQCSEMLDKLGKEAVASVDPKIIESVASLAKATTSAIDSLSKLKIAEDKLTTQKELAKLANESKNKDDENRPKGLMMSREDLMKYLTAGLPSAKN